MSIVSDSAGVDEAKDPDKSVIYSIYSLFCDEEEKKKLRERFLTPGLRYGDIKKELADRITEYFAPYRKKRDELLSNLDYVEQILSKGKEKAGNAAEAKLSQVRKTLGVQRKIKR